MDEFRDTSEIAVDGIADKVNFAIENYARQGISFRYVCSIKERFDLFTRFVKRKNLIDLSEHNKLVTAAVKRKIADRELRELREELGFRDGPASGGKAD